MTLGIASATPQGLVPRDTLPTGEADLYSVPDCTHCRFPHEARPVTTSANTSTGLDTGAAGVVYQTISNLVANQCYSSSAITIGPTNTHKFQSYYGYLKDGSVPAGYKCEGKAFFTADCTGTSIGNGGNANACENTLRSPEKLALTAVGAASYMWACTRT